MAIQNEPTRITIPFADAGTKNVIPDTNSTPSASQAASWTDGFPAQCSLPLSAGGIPPARADFNGILNAMTQSERFTQEGGVWAWDATVDYATNRLVLGSDGKLYWSVAQSGPNVGGAQDPTADDGTYWTAMPTDNADMVHKSGDETITGVKTVLGTYALSPSGTATEFVLAVPDVSILDDVAVPAEVKAASIQFMDKGGLGAGSGIGVVEVVAPNPDSQDFVMNVGMKTIGSYSGTAYGGGHQIWIVEGPNARAYTDIFHLMVRGTHPFLSFRNQAAPTKGTLPSTTRASTIRFCDGDVDAAFSTATDSFKEHTYALIDSDVTSNGTDILTLRCFVNDNTKTDVVELRLEIAQNLSKIVRPGTNGDITLGASNYRWGQIYSTSSTISTSDARLKTEPESVPDEVLDAWGDIGFIQFQMLDSVAKKGANVARLHSGLIAQRIDEAFKARGLDASRYGLFCWDGWEAVPEDRDEDGNIVQEAREAGDCYSLRYEEALCMEAAYQRRRADRAEARITALEERLAALEARLA